MIYNTDGLFRKDSNTVISMLQNVEGIDEDIYDMKSNKNSGPGFARLVPKQRRILIIDDEGDIALSLRLVLGRNGFKTVSCTDPLLAYKNFRNGQYDLAILDIKMMDFSCTRK